MVTNSRNVAEVTGKRHDNVIRDIDALVLSLSETGSSNLRDLMFQEVTAFDPAANRETRAFEMTRDGMALLVMGYTTPRAMDQVSKVSRGHLAFHDLPTALLIGRFFKRLNPCRVLLLLTILHHLRHLRVRIQVASRRLISSLLDLSSGEDSGHNLICVEPVRHINSWVRR